MKAALVTRDKFIKYLEVDDKKPPYWFATIRPYSIDFVYNYKPDDNLMDRTIEKTEFRLDRVYKNEFEEKVAVYYEV